MITIKKKNMLNWKSETKYIETTPVVEHGWKMAINSNRYVFNCVKTRETSWTAESDKFHSMGL